MSHCHLVLQWTGSEFMCVSDSLLEQSESMLPEFCQIYFWVPRRNMSLIMRTYKSLHKRFPPFLFNTLLSVVNKNEVLLQHHLKHLHPVAVLPSGLFSVKLQTDLQGPLNYVEGTMLKLLFELTRALATLVLSLSCCFETRLWLDYFSKCHVFKKHYGSGAVWDEGYFLLSSTRFEKNNLCQCVSALR